MPIRHSNLKEHNGVAQWERSLFDDNFTEIHRLENAAKMNEVVEANTSGNFSFTPQFRRVTTAISRHGQWGYIRISFQSEVSKDIDTTWGGLIDLHVANVNSSNNWPLEDTPLTSIGPRWGKGYFSTGGGIHLQFVSNNLRPNQTFTFAAFYRRANMTAPDSQPYLVQPDKFSLDRYNTNLDTLDTRIEKANGGNMVFDRAPVGISGLINPVASRIDLVDTDPAAIVRFGNVCHFTAAFKPKKTFKSNSYGELSVEPFFTVSNRLDVKYATAIETASSTPGIPSPSIAAEITNSGIYLRNCNRNNAEFTSSIIIQLAGTFLMKDA